MATGTTPSGPTASLPPFDHAVVYVPSLELYLDGTAEPTGSDELPALDRGALGLLIEPRGGRVVHLPEPGADRSVSASKLRLRLGADGELRFDGSLSNRGVDAPAWRHRYRDPSGRRERVASDLAELLGPVELRAGTTGLTVSALDDVEQPVRLKVAGAAKAVSEGDGWSVPLGWQTRLVARFASLPARRSTLRVGPRHQRISAWVLTVPRGWRVLTAPAPSHVVSPFGRYEMKVERRAGSLEVHTELRIDAARIAPADYPAWRRFCQQVDAVGRPRVTVAR